ncbi:MAG: radical SAM protein, partial [Rhodospirillales bacterium]
MAKKTYVPNPRKVIFVETSARCNLACRFCAYSKFPPGGFMADDLYDRVIKEVCDLGFEFVWLTPMLGEAFADPNIMKRFTVLEESPRIRGYAFYSNFIMARKTQIEYLERLAKLASIHISVYGFDEIG